MKTQKSYYTKRPYTLIIAISLVVLTGSLLAGTFGVLFSPTANALVSSSSTGSHNFLFSIGPQGNGDGQLSGTYQAAINPNTGNLYVADGDNNRIQEFTSDGTYITQWGTLGSDAGEFEYPTGIAINPNNNNVYVADYYNQRIQQFTADGAFVRQWDFNSSYGLVVNPNNNHVYATDWNNSQVAEFTADGTPVRQWGSNGSNDGQFADPDGIEVNPTNNHLFVVDYNNNRVQEFTSDGTFVKKWGTYGSGDGEFASPYGIALDSETGHLFVADESNYRIQEFDLDGNYIGQFGTHGSGPGQFQYPADIAINPINHRIYTVDWFNHVQVFGTTNNLAQETIPYTSSLANLALPVGSDITNESIASATASDTGYSYPLGLYHFTFTTPNHATGTTIPVQITFQTDLTPSTVVPRKFNTSSGTYTTIPNASVTSTTVGGKPALLLSYEITDGGTLDSDGAANGVIVDPVGLGLKTSTSQTQHASVGAPNTGLSRFWLLDNYTHY